MAKDDNKSIDEVETSEKILDRTIGFINSCDSKASITLALIGILLTVICTEVPSYIMNARSVENFKITATFVIYIVCVVTSFMALVVSISLLISVLYGRVSGLKKSSIYFGDIKSIQVDEYKKRIRKLTNQEYEEDLIEQVHINACICAKKYKRFNSSLIFLAIGMVLFIAAIFLEIFAL